MFPEASCPPGSPLDFLLTDRERQVAQELGRRYEETYGLDPCQNEDLFYYLQDSAARGCWSGSSGRLPTLRRGSGKMWAAAARRWLTGKEKMATLGMPVTQSVASAMTVPILRMSDCARAHSVAGNSMHFATVGVVQLVAMASFALAPR